MFLQMTMKMLRTIKHGFVVRLYTRCMVNEACVVDAIFGLFWPYCCVADVNFTKTPSRLVGRGIHYQWAPLSKRLVGATADQFIPPRRRKASLFVQCSLFLVCCPSSAVDSAELKGRRGGSERR